MPNPHHQRRHYDPDGHVLCDQEAQPSEHPPLGRMRLIPDHHADSRSQILVVHHH